MKYRYAKPNLITYHREQIMEFMGPVKTQYCDSCSNVTASPNAFLQGKTFDQTDPLQVSVNTGGCTAFRQVEISIPGTSPLIFFEFNRGDGSESGNTWSVDIVGFQFLDDRGNYPLVVTLLDGAGGRASCQTTITVE